MLDIYCLSQSFFDISGRAMGNKSNQLILLNQTTKDTGNIYREVGVYDMRYDDFKFLCRKSWEEDFFYLCIDRSKKRYQGRYYIFIESKNTYTECTPETNPV